MSKIRRYINIIIAKTILQLLRNNVCCMNCEYYYAETIKDSFCSIDKEIINVEISMIVKCKAFKSWFGVVD